jgi:hypothetical protein
MNESPPSPGPCQSLADKAIKMGQVRPIINLTCALALTGVSAGLLVYLIFFARTYYLWMPISAVLGICVGLYWLWTDFIKSQAFDLE